MKLYTVTLLLSVLSCLFCPFTFALILLWMAQLTVGVALSTKSLLDGHAHQMHISTSPSRWQSGASRSWVWRSMPAAVQGPTAEATSANSPQLSQWLVARPWCCWWVSQWRGAHEPIVWVFGLHAGIYQWNGLWIQMGSHMGSVKPGLERFIHWQATAQFNSNWHTSEIFAICW